MVFYECSQVFFRFFGKVEKVLWKIRLSFIVFLFFEGGSCFWLRIFWPMKSLFNITSEPIVLLLGFASFSRVYCLSNISNLRKWKVPFEKLTAEKNILSGRETWELSLFSADWKFRYFTLVVFYIFATILLTKLKNDSATGAFRGETFFWDVSAFLANLTPLMRENECQKTFGEVHGVSAFFFHAFDNAKTGVGYTCWCENFLNANERVWKAGILLKINKCSQTNSQSVPLLQ